MLDWLSDDLVVGALAFLLWSYAEARRLEMRGWRACVVLTFAVAFARAFPLLLLMREHRLEALER